MRLQETTRPVKILEKRNRHEYAKRSFRIDQCSRVSDQSWQPAGNQLPVRLTDT
jgi:hypothetical protein